MKHLKALGIKYIVISIVLLSVLGIFSDTSITEILMISLLVTGVSYIAGDLFILPKMGNVIATIADFGLAFFMIWALSYMFLERTPTLIAASLFAAMFIALSEAIFHAYLQNKVLDKEPPATRRQQFKPNYQTEFSEENNVHLLKRRKRK